VAVPVPLSLQWRVAFFCAKQDNLQPGASFNLSVIKEKSVLADI
jgi:hypothetical protein